MRKCIICNMEKDEAEFNEEHVFPRILGNKTFTIHNVCETCNSVMGAKLIAPLSESDFIVSFRKKHRLKGNSGKQAQYKRLISDNNGVKVTRDQNGRIVIGPQLQNTEDGFMLIGSNLKDLQNIAQSKMKKAGKQFTCQIEERMLVGSFQENIDGGFVLAYVAVCYESMFYLFGYDYLNDNVAKELQSAIYNYLYREPKVPPLQIRDIDNDISAIFYSTFHGDKNSVMIVLSFDETSVGAVFIVDGISLLDIRVGDNEGWRYGKGTLILALEDGRAVKFDQDYILPNK